MLLDLTTNGKKSLADTVVLPSHLEREKPGGSAALHNGVVQKEWNNGDLILDDFTVIDILGEGGMGKVFLVQSRTTGMRFAVKRTKAPNEEARRNFLAELQTWIDLPEHPNLLACRFFRSVGNDILIFAEYVPGNSLEDWIVSRRLYGLHEKNPKKALERMLDIIIQFAWGQHCLHILGLVHQDVKPANVMMTVEIAKGSVRAQVTDFGLAHTRLAGGQQHIPKPVKDILPSFGGYTPVYCSPEQENRRKVTFKTDIWSWAVSVLEMFSGKIFWSSGSVAGAVLEEFLKNGGCSEGIPRMPEELAGILRECLIENPEQRLESLGEAVERLKKVYRDETGMEYDRALIDPIVSKEERKTGVGERRTRWGTAWTDPLVWLKRALAAEGWNQAEAEKILAQQGISRRGQLVAELAGYDAAKHVYDRLINAGRKDLEEELAKLCSEKAFVHETSGDDQGAIAEYERSIGIYERLVKTESRSELANDLAYAYMNKATVIHTIGNNTAAIGLYDQALEIWERLVKKDDRHELANNLAKLYANKANTLSNLGDNIAANTLFDQAIEIWERLVNKAGRRELANNLATTYMNKAIGQSALGDNRTAVGLFDQALDIYGRLVNIEGMHEFANLLATAYMNKALAKSTLGDNSTAVGLCDQALEIYEQLVNVEGRREFAYNLANVYLNKAGAVSTLGDNMSAVELFDQALEIYEQLVNVEGRRELAYHLATAYMNKAEALSTLGDNLAAVGLCDQALEIWERLVNTEGRREFANDLANEYREKAKTLSVLGKHQNALELFDRAIEIYEQLINTDGKCEFAGDLASVKAHRGLLMVEIGNTEIGRQEAEKAVVVLRQEIKRTGRADLKKVLEDVLVHF